MRFRRSDAGPILDDLEAWLRTQLSKISGKTPLAAAIRYALTRLPRVRPYLEDGRLALDNNTAERAMRGVAISRKTGYLPGRKAVERPPPLPSP